MNQQTAEQITEMIHNLDPAVAATACDWAGGLWGVEIETGITTPDGRTAVLVSLGSDDSGALVANYGDRLHGPYSDEAIRPATTDNQPRMCALFALMLADARELPRRFAEGMRRAYSDLMPAAVDPRTIERARKIITERAEYVATYTHPDGTNGDDSAPQLLEAVEDAMRAEAENERQAIALHFNLVRELSNTAADVTRPEWDADERGALMQTAANKRASIAAVALEWEVASAERAALDLLVSVLVFDLDAERAESITARETAAAVLAIFDRHTATL